jgi:hypothetical protein
MARAFRIYSKATRATRLNSESRQSTRLSGDRNEPRLRSTLELKTDDHLRFTFLRYRESRLLVLQR